MRPIRPVELLLAAGLSLLAAAAVLSHQKDDSPTFDEPYHLYAGLEYAADGTFWLNLEHPPLLKLLAGASLRPLGVTTPGRGRPAETTPHGGFLDWFYRNRLPADALVAAGRAPFPWVLSLLVLVVWGAARTLWGPVPALLAAGLVAFEPNFVGHAGLIHTDVGAALTMTAAAVLSLLACEKGRAAVWAAAGAALGVALATKFTAVLLVPLVLVLPLVWGVTGRPRPAGGRVAGNLLGALLALAAALAVLWGVYAFCMRNMPAARAEAAVRWYLADRQAPPATIRRFAALSRLSPPLGHYAAGLAGVSLISGAGRGANYFRGEVSEKAFPLYFPAAFLVKTTPAFLLFAFAALLFGGRELLRFRILALLLPAAVVLAAAVRSHFNIGVRHILPVYALLAIAGAGLLAERIPRFFPALAAALLLGSAASLLASHPDEMSYFNAIAGGPEGGSRWLSDSNVDWGQDLKRLGRFLREKGWEETTTIVAYSGVAMNYYSPKARVLDPAVALGPGRYAVGATTETIGPWLFARLEGPASGRQVAALVRLLRERGVRVARVGGSITIWELPPAAFPPGPS